MEGFAPLRPGGGADLPPPPQQQQHQTPPYWYPPPPPPPASSSSPHPHHPPPPYSLPPYHHYPPPHPHNNQWPPPSYAPQPPPYAPAPPRPYPPGPPHHMPPRPPQQMTSYPPPNQAWPNQPPAPYEGQHYPGASLPQNDGEDWAAKAKAWAAANSTTGAHNGIPVDHSYLHQNGETPLDYSQKINAGGGVAVPGAGAGADQAPLVSPVKNYDSFSAVYEQEVPSYSSSQGSKDKLPRYDNTQDHPPFAVPPAPDRYYHQQPDPSYMVNYGHDPGPAPHLWGPPASVGPYPPPNLPPHPAQQYDIPTAVHPSMPVPNYGPPNIPPAAFNAPPVASHLNTELYHGDPLALNQINKSKKAAVPSWLREEILKKKTTIGSNSSAQVGSDGGDKSPDATTDQTDSKSVDSTKIAEEEDDEDEVEAARTVAINQEIKRILTEVLLKVTDDLFEEIATKVLSEDDDMAGEGTSEPTLVKSKLHSSAPSTSGNAKIQDKGANGSASIGKAVIPDESTKGGGGVLLGLLDYDTDDDGDDENASTDRIKQNPEPEMNNSSSLIKNDLLSDQNQRELNLKREDAEVLPSPSEGIVNTKFEEEESHTKEDSRVEVKAGQAANGDILRARFVDGNDNIEKLKVMIDSEDGFKNNEREESKEGRRGGLTEKEEKNKEGGRGGLMEKEEKSKEGSRGGLREKEEKNKEERDEMIDGNILTDKRRRSREDDRETERKDDKENKLGDLKGSKREISKEEKDKTTERDDKKDKREKSNEERERKTERRDDKEDSSKDRRERNREEKEKRAERRDDKEDSSKERRERSREEKERRAERSSRGKSDKSKEEREREMNKRDDKERSRHSKRSTSPRDRSRSKEHSDSTKRRRTESNKRSMSRSPTRSRHRRDSRSPHSKHSHRRNSAYSTSDRRRSRSRTPTRRRRSRSRTPSRRR